MEGCPSAAAEYNDEVVDYNYVLKVLREGTTKLQGGKLTITGDDGAAVTLNNSEVIEGIALHTTNMIVGTIRQAAGTDVLTGAQLMQVARILTDHWRLTWKRTQRVHLPAISATMDLSSAMFMYVLSCEKELHASVETGLDRAIECASILTLAIDLLVVGAGGQIKKHLVEQVGRHLSGSEEDGVAVMFSLFECVRMLFGVLRKAIMWSPRIPSYEHGELRQFADPIGISLISIALFCADQGIYGKMVSKVPESVVAMVLAGLRLLEYPIVFPYCSERLSPKTISSDCCGGGIELLMARCLSLLAQVMINTSPDFLDSLPKGKLNEHMTTITKRVIDLFRLTLQRPKLTEGERCNGELQLQQSFLCLLIELSDRTELRGLVLDGLSPTIARLLVLGKDNFVERWCGGRESFLLYTRNIDNQLMVTLHSSQLASILRKISDAINQLHLFDERTISPFRTLPRTMFAEAQQYVALRSILMANLLGNLGMCAPREEKNLFAKCLVKSVKVFLKDSFVEDGANLMWTKLQELLKFLTPMESFPLHTPIVESNIVKSLKILGFAMDVVSSQSAAAARVTCTNDDRGGMTVAALPGQSTQGRVLEGTGDGTQQPTPSQQPSRVVKMIVIDGESDDNDGGEMADSGDVQIPGSSSPASRTAVNTDKGPPHDVSVVPCQEAPVPDSNNSNEINVRESNSAIEDQHVSGAGRQGVAEKMEAPRPCGGQQTCQEIDRAVVNGGRGNAPQTSGRSGIPLADRGSLKRGLESTARVADRCAVAGESGQDKSKVAKRQQGDVTQASRGSHSLQRNLTGSPHSHMPGPVPQMPYSPGMIGNLYRGLVLGNPYMGPNQIGHTRASMSYLPVRPGHVLHVQNPVVLRPSSCPPPQPEAPQGRGRQFSQFFPAVIGVSRPGGDVHSGAGDPAPVHRWGMVPQSQGISIRSTEGIRIRNTQQCGVPEIVSTPVEEGGDRV